MSQTTVKVAIHRLRERLWGKVGDVVAGTLSDPDELADELRHLVASLVA